MVDLYGGHVIPGVGYLAYAIWWSLTTTVRYVQSSEKSHGKPYKSSVAMPAIFLPTSLPWYVHHPAFESGFRFVCSLVGLIFHPIDAMDDYYKARAGDVKFTVANESMIDRWELVYRVQHHFALYFAFAFGSFIEVTI